MSTWSFTVQRIDGGVYGSGDDRDRSTQGAGHGDWDRCEREGGGPGPVRAERDQLDRLLAWARSWSERTWAVEGAAGLGHLLAQQLLAAGERVSDLPPKLAAKARLLSDGIPTSTTPTMVARCRWPGCPRRRCARAERDDCSAVMGMWSQRYWDLVAARTQVVCRLHALLYELIQGGFPGVLRARQAAKVLEDIQPDSPMGAARLALAQQLLADLIRIDEQRRRPRRR
jgi:transposase